ncbi:hypothetical protein AOQ72_26510 [Bradyrhizobium yuanmingense]|uniref:Uncharacterized protein n=1 Tax=Bradyrhizobium yuanmingense TaxID=108015 RepID=A0A0R3CCS6_9BRAD|nr:hypothetical protein AOQ72_26510 [Bradyrhizobium yuanmingense]PWE77493.1 hypothetical protein XF30_12780 [Bradyrhizobium sp. SUTN9-2]
MTARQRVLGGRHECVYVRHQLIELMRVTRESRRVPRRFFYRLKVVAEPLMIRPEMASSMRARTQIACRRLYGGQTHTISSCVNFEPST